jgi:AcrR family transcriptional regulator
MDPDVSRCHHHSADVSDCQHHYYSRMARWKPDARGRLVQAALALYGEHGYENTTVAEIAQRAGLTERTFFRHFADKREVLFDGGNALQALIVSVVADAPDSLAPIDAAAAGLEAAGEQFFVHDRRDFSRQRQAVIASSPELQERELTKLAGLSTAIADALRRRGVDDPAATLTAEVAIAVFRTAFERWIDETNRRDFPQLVRESLDQLKALTAA